MMILSFGREEATRTPDPYVPNVVRYQLRYFSDSLRSPRLFADANFLDFTKAGAKVLLFFDIRKFFAIYFALFRLKVCFPGFIGSDLAIISRTSASLSAAGSLPFGS